MQLFPHDARHTMLSFRSTCSSASIPVVLVMVILVEQRVVKLTDGLMQHVFLGMINESAIVQMTVCVCGPGHDDLKGCSLFSITGKTNSVTVDLKWHCAQMICSDKKHTTQKSFVFLYMFWTAHWIYIKKNKHQKKKSSFIHLITETETEVFYFEMLEPIKGNYWVFSSLSSPNKQ